MFWAMKYAWKFSWNCTGFHCRMTIHSSHCTVTKHGGLELGNGAKNRLGFQTRENNKSTRPSFISLLVFGNPDETVALVCKILRTVGTEHRQKTIR